MQPKAMSPCYFMAMLRHTAELQVFLQDRLYLLADVGVWNEEGDTPMKADVRERPWIWSRPTQNIEF